MNTTDKIMTIIGEAFREGFYSVRTYNDTVLNNADEEFQSAATSLAKKVIAEIEALVRERDELMQLLKIVRGKHGAGILTLPPADLERFDAAMQEKQS